MKDLNGTYHSEDERQAMMERANKAYLESKAAKQGAYGQKRNAQIEALRSQIDNLENSPVKSAKEAVDNMSRAKALRNQLDSMLSTGYDVLAAQDFNSRVAEQKAAQFSDIQASLLSAEAEKALAVDKAKERIVYNTAIGVKQSTIDRQLGKLLAGEGQSDEHGRYVRFGEGRHDSVYRAYVNADGDYAIVLESRGGANNDLGDLAE